ncbi:radical SAM protein [Rhizobium ruizarguesonis]
MSGAHVLLVRPPFRDTLEYKPQPMALCCLGAQLKKYRPNVTVEVLDAVAHDLDWQRTAEAIIEKAPDIVGITLKTPQAPNAFRICRKLKAETGIKVMVGGNHVTVQPEECLRNGADIAVIGEGEETILEVVDALLSKMPIANPPKGSAVLRDERYVFGGMRPLGDYEGFPPPDWSLIDLSVYNENIHVNHRQALQVMASRGCPFRCSFCSTYLTWSHAVRWRPALDVVEELRDGLEFYKHDTFHFYDDDLLESRQWFEQFLDVLEASQLPILWHGIVRVENVLKCRDLLPRALTLGCQGFAFGFEAGNDSIYKKQKKGMKLSTTLEAAKLMSDVGFPIVEPLLMNLYPGETVESMIVSARTLDFMRRDLGIDLHTSRYWATPYPGTRFFNEAERDGKTISEDWDGHYTHYVNFVPYSFLQSQVATLNLDIQKYRPYFRLHFLTHGDFNKYLRPEELGAFLDNIDEELLLDEFATLIRGSSSFDDLSHSMADMCELSLASAYELCCKLLVHSALFDCLSLREMEECIA